MEHCALRSIGNNNSTKFYAAKNQNTACNDYLENLCILE